MPILPPISKVTGQAPIQFNAFRPCKLIVRKTIISNIKYSQDTGDSRARDKVEAQQVKELSADSHVFLDIIRNH